MKDIKISKGKIALVDDEDYRSLIHWKWSCHISPYTCYAFRRQIINGSGVEIKMHRQIMNLDSTDLRLVDHRDGNGLNNQKSNLRICNRSQNNMNAKKKRDGIVELYDVKDMRDGDAAAACIENAPKRKAWLLRNWKYFSRDFNFSKRKVAGSFQWLFDITIPDDVTINPFMENKNQ